MLSTLVLRLRNPWRTYRMSSSSFLFRSCAASAFWNSFCRMMILRLFRSRSMSWPARLICTTRSALLHALRRRRVAAAKEEPHLPRPVQQLLAVFIFEEMPHVDVLQRIVRIQRRTLVRRRESPAQLSASLRHRCCGLSSSPLWRTKTPSSLAGTVVGGGRYLLYSFHK